MNTIEGEKALDLRLHLLSYQNLLLISNAEILFPQQDFGQVQNFIGFVVRWLALFSFPSI